MLIELTSDGGFAAFPGLAKPIRLDDATLLPELRGELDALVNAAIKETSAAGAGPAHSVPDGRRHHITIKRDGTVHELSAADPAVPPAFKALMAFIKAKQ